MTDRDKAFDQWWNLSIHNATLPPMREPRKNLAREAYYAAWGGGAADEIERLRALLRLAREALTGRDIPT